MNNQPILTIVTATRGNFGDRWLEELLKIKGNVQFILVYPPNATVRDIDDVRIKNLISPFKGEVTQRFTGLINADSEYVMALDDDDYLHHDIADLVAQYFAKFADSWVLRLNIAKVDDTDEENIKKEWRSLTNIEELEICKKTPENPFPYQNGKFQGLLEVPIAPLDKPLDIRHVIFPWKQRTDQNGIHFENFNNRVWQTKLVKSALSEISAAMKIKGALTWLPAWSLDRLLGLFIQAKFYQKDAIIGHAMPKQEQIRFIMRDSALKETRIYLLAEILLLKCYPQYGYLWNLCIWQVYTIPRILAKSIKIKYLRKFSNKTNYSTIKST
ncbi:MAG: glycosyltransferase family 2 protein [Rivularia sp. (in: cyanobacteria)]